MTYTRPLFVRPMIQVMSPFYEAVIQDHEHLKTVRQRKTPQQKHCTLVTL